VKDAQERKCISRSVINLSVGGPRFEPVNLAVANAVAAGLPVVVAAGNYGKDAAQYSPASEASAITVGAIDDKDRRWGNWGTAIDVFAPGVNVLSAGKDSDTAEAWMVGTSQGWCPLAARRFSALWR
jgi:subtilisin family serine protease